MSVLTPDAMLHVIPPGPGATLAYAVTDNGEVPARDFLESDEVPDQDKAALLHWFRLLVQQGRISNKDRFKKLANSKIWEFRSGQIRIGAFQSGHIWYLTHGFVKKKDRWGKQQLARAESIREQQLRRV